MEPPVNITKGLSFHSKDALWVYLFCFSYIVAVGSTLVPIFKKAQDMVSGKGFDVNAESAFVVVTASFINACVKAITSKYTTSLSDYTGRKPVLIISCMMFIVTRICLIFTTSVTGLYILAAIAGTFDSAFPICQAWLCDLLPSKNRSMAFSLLIGLGFGLGMDVGLPIGAAISQNYTADLAFIVAVILQAVANHRVSRSH
jgi:MFS family permease